ncbi:MAG: ABC1 kinase family protein [Mycobacterium leprae]
MPFSRSQVVKRYRTVLRVLTRYGFGALAEQLGLPGAGAAPASAGGGAGRGERLRRAFEELGPTFVKLGQLLSTRSDLLPPDVLQALEQLQDQVAPLPFATVQRVLEAELGAPLSDRFAQIEPEPIAAASLGQVHRATLADGQEAVIKIQRPGAAEAIGLDLQVLKGLAAVANRHSRRARNYHLPAIVSEFGSMLEGELDYHREGENGDRFRRNFAGEQEVRFPSVFWSHSTGRVLTLEQVGGFRVTDREAMAQAGIDYREVARSLSGAVFRMVLRDGFFHADPHPGNLFVGRQGQIIFVDMGMVGELTPEMRANVVDYVVGVVSRDSERVVEAILHMGMVPPGYDRRRLRHDVERLQRKYAEVPIRQVQFGEALREMLSVARGLEISFPATYTILVKAMITLESVCRQIDPEATLVELASPYAEELLKQGMEPAKLLGRVGRELLQASTHAVRLPQQLSQLLALMNEGELRMAVEHTGVDPAMRRLTAITNRLVIAILLASLIIGTALVSSSGRGSFLQRYPVADVGFLAIGAVGLWLVLSILASGR